MTDLCTKDPTAIRDVIQKSKTSTWDLDVSPKVVKGLKLILEAAELQSGWSKFMSQIFLDSLIPDEDGEESEWYIEVRLCRKE